MKRLKENRFTFNAAKKLVAATLVLAATAGVCKSQQSQPALAITSPANGTVVNPGQAMSVTVTSPAGSTFQLVYVVGENPIGGSDSVATTLPAQFTITIPANIHCGKYGLIPMGTDSSGRLIPGQGIRIDVERPDLPTALSPMNSSHIYLGSLGQQVPVIVEAKFADGTVQNVTGSANLTFSSSDPTIAQVSSTGMVTAGVQGSATITATYTLNGQSISLAIPVTVLPPVMLVTPPFLTFGDQNVGTSSAPQQLTVTNKTHYPMQILQVGATGDVTESDNCLASSPLAADGGSCTVNVTFSPSGIGSRTGYVSIINKTSGGRTFVIAQGTGIGQPTTTTSLSSSANPAVFGQSVTVTASVSSASSGAPTGTVTFSDGSTVLGTEPLTNGQATFTTSTFAVGSHSVTASYSGDSTFLASSGTLAQTVNPASTQTTVSPSANPAILNGPLTLTATVTVSAPGAGSPTGAVTFSDGSTTLGTVPINASGQATYTSSTLVVGSHSITAVYSGDANFNASTSAALSQAVQYEPAGTSCAGDLGHAILQPIAPDGSSVFNQGRTVPAKFRVCDANGVSIGTPGVVGNFYLTQTVAGTVTTTVEDVVDTNNPDTAFRWDATDQQWIFNISTTNLSANETYVYTITLNDGTTINFQLGLR